MSGETPLPLRPRLADHAQLRRNIVDGVERLVVHDGATNEVLEIDERAFRMLACADGTRDFGGILLAAVRDGVYRYATEIHGLLSQLQERGLLTDGIDAGNLPRESHPDRPLSVLPDFTLVCDCNGTCCSSHGAILFTREDARRAEELVPDCPTDAESRDRTFLPLQSSVPLQLLSVTMVDGKCAYLAEDGKCRIQIAGGADAKPGGCRIFPAHFVDDGESIRVSVLIECPCVLESIGCDDGASLVPDGAATEADLVQGSHIVRLPREIRLTEKRTGTRADLRRWADAVAPMASGLANPLAAVWAMADSVRDDGLVPPVDRETLDSAAAPPAVALRFPLEGLLGRTDRLLAAVAAQKLEKTPAGELAVWFREAVSSLHELERLDRRLGESPANPEHERFALRAMLFGHLLVSDGQPVETGLRDLALRLLLARQLDRTPADKRPHHPAAPFPFVVVQALMRGQGLGRRAS